MKGTPYPDPVSIKKTSPQSLRILAVLVEFQEEKPEDPTTVGNGKFGSIYTAQYGNSILDPLPHDESYFSLHLKFAQNYFRAVSNGNLTLSYTVLPKVTVSKRIRDYAPAANSSDLTSLGTLAKEVWPLAKEQNPGIDFSSYDAFVIFHAGVGRDISIPGSLGNDRDLPSVYLSDNMFRNTIGGDLSGLPLNRDGKYNTMIIPETESREIEDITGAKNLLQISINGLVVSSIGSHLGLPDLFDTKTGLSAIGRFGLMDGQAIFTFSGLFPPEPSPWEKMFLGWTVPVEANINGGTLNLKALRAAQPGDTTLIKVPINSREYYLVENRSRDALKNGAVVTYVVGQDTLTRVFPKDTSGFSYESADSLKGVVINVDEYDWAVPGNGIVVWHIDENVINEKISTNTINTDKFRRGVDVEEADGVQEIGEKFTTILGDEVVGEGTEFDFWYKSNPSTLFTNRFSFDTQPPARTNSGANSLVTMSNFSDVSDKMSFNLSFGDTVVKPLAYRKLPFGLSSLRALGLNLYALKGTSLLRLSSMNGTILDSVTAFSSAALAASQAASEEVVAGIVGNRLKGYIYNGANAVTAEQVLSENPSTAPAITEGENTQRLIAFGTEKGKVVFYAPGTASAPGFTLIREEHLPSLDFPVLNLALDGTNYSAFYKVAEGSYGLIDPLKKEYFFTSPAVKIALTKDKNGNYVTVVLTSDNEISVLSNGEFLKTINLRALGDSAVTSFSLGDLKQNGENYVIISGKNLNALNLRGAQADNFPFEDPQGIGFNSTPLVFYNNQLGATEILAVTKDGRTFAVNAATGRVIKGFPVSSGQRVSTNPVLFNTDRTALSLVTADSLFYTYTVSSGAENIYWASENGSSSGNSFLAQAQYTNRQSVFMPKERAYNWPNPVYGEQTNIRYFVSEDSKIEIKIFDLAGDLVAELSDNARGGLDNETVWNVSGVQSGVYFARIQATGVTGKTENNTVKIAIIK
ncbi:MAG: T9SS type A sorting domain-containing protein [Ignavibacteria bacterium]|nr:T9SS type A sorting domain-containing protein [Ignavibacteria bacterium]MCU7502218.1 T9SS type A sorting domain-containing protein [Ignavibacteria bacterium]MCU7517435.1 T9SS type A sorting domain-containing protein [Ignavibacteria bacterium]